MSEWFRNIPGLIDPIALELGPLSIRWYALCFVGAFLVAWLLTMYRIRKGEGEFKRDFIESLFFVAFVGAIIGGRIGYAVIYDPAFFLGNPFSLIVPWDMSTGQWIGISGMSFHGALVGVLLACYLFVRSRKASFLELADFIAPTIGLGYALGRLGNFLNGELYGRITDGFPGMYFESELRYPSQLFEGFAEGLVPFTILWMMRNRPWRPGTLFVSYLALVSIGRFLAEFYRQPDPQIGFVAYGLTMGQALSIASLLLISLAVFLVRKNHGIIDTVGSSPKRIKSDRNS